MTVPHSSKYHNDLMRLRCAPQLLNLGIFPNAKEMTESFASLAAAERVLGGPEAATRDDVLAFVIGDGVCPRTGVTLALRTKWQVVSVDPLLRPEWAGFEPMGVRRLQCFADRVEDRRFKSKARDTVMIFPHSHASVEKSIWCVRVSGRRHVVAMQCCFPLEVPNREPDEVFEDLGVASAKREFKLWRDV